MTPEDRRILELAVHDAFWLCAAVLDAYRRAVAGFSAPGQTCPDIDRVAPGLHTLAQGCTRLARVGTALTRRPEDRAAIKALKAEAAPVLSGAPLSAPGGVKDVPDARLLAMFLGLTGTAVNMLAIVGDFAAWRHCDAPADLPGLLAELDRVAPLLQAAHDAGWSRIEAGGLGAAHLN